MLWHLLRKVENHFFLLYLLVQFSEISLSMYSETGLPLYWGFKVKTHLVLILGSILITVLFHCCPALLLYGNLSPLVCIGFWGHLKEPMCQGNSGFYADV